MRRSVLLFFTFQMLCWHRSLGQTAMEVSRQAAAAACTAEPHSYPLTMAMGTRLFQTSLEINSAALGDLDMRQAWEATPCVARGQLTK